MAPIAYMAMFFGFHSYDDEGYMLVTLRDYLSGGPLVTPYVNLYGPFFYEVMGGLYRLLGLQPGTDNGRFITLTVWLIASLVGGLAAYRLTRNLWLGLTAQLVAFLVLTALVSEPMTTYGLISLLLMGMALAATFSEERPRTTAVVIGAIVGALCLVKINVGCFAAVAVAFAWVGGLRPRWKRLLSAPALLATAGLPFALMAPMLSHDWVLEFAFVAFASAVAMGVVSLRARPAAPQRAPSGSWLAAGGTLLLVVCLGVALAGGTRAGDMWNGLVVASIRFPGIFVLPPAINVTNDLWAALSLAVAIVMSVRYTSARNRPEAGLVPIWAGFIIWLSVLREPSSIFLLGLPLVWMASQRPRDDVKDPTGPYCRLLLPAMAVTESLQIYPVAGSQLALAALMLVPVGAIVVNDGIRQLRTAGVARSAALKVATWAAPSMLLINVAAFVLFGVVTVVIFRQGTPLGLPGAQFIRLPLDQATQMRELVAAINEDCSSFITYPGMDSMYVWTDQTPPTPMRYGLWWLSLDDVQQQSIVDELEGRQRLCVIKNQTVNELWAQGRQVPGRPLVKFIDQRFVDSATYGEYELLLRPASGT